MQFTKQIWLDLDNKVDELQKVDTKVNSVLEDSIVSLSTFDYFKSISY